MSRVRCFTFANGLSFFIFLLKSTKTFCSKKKCNRKPFWSLPEIFFQNLMKNYLKTLILFLFVEVHGQKRYQIWKLLKSNFDFENLPEGLPSACFIHFELCIIHICVFAALKCFDSGRWSEIWCETRVFPERNVWHLKIFSNISVTLIEWSSTWGWNILINSHFSSWTFFFNGL